MTTPTRPATDARGENQKPPRFTDMREVRRVPLANLKTDEEARLAAEIEKLRD